MSVAIATRPSTVASLTRGRAPRGTREQSEERGLRVARLNVVPLLGAVLFSLTTVAAMVYFQGAFAGMGNWGYLANSGIQMASSATIVIPVPGSVYTLAMGSTLNPLVLGLLGGVGAAVGELTAYMVGASGRGMVHESRLYRRMQTLTTRWGGLTLFAFALLPFPFDVAGIWAGIARYPVRRFLLFVAAGKAIQLTAVATVGNYGTSWLLGLIN